MKRISKRKVAKAAKEKENYMKLELSRNNNVPIDKETLTKMKAAKIACDEYFQRTKRNHSDDLAKYETVSNLFVYHMNIYKGHGDKNWSLEDCCCVSIRNSPEIVAELLKEAKERFEEFKKFEDYRYRYPCTAFHEIINVSPIQNEGK